MVEFIGRNGNLALFSNDAEAVVINTDLNLVVGVGDHAALSSARVWEPTEETFSNSVVELASGAVTTLDINVITASARMYTIPDGAKAEAKKALEWRKEEKRGGTPVGLNTARTLAKGGQIGIEKVRHIAKYFARHEVDKKGKGYKPGDDGFPSNGRIAWALWGGDTAWRWAKAIVERENKKAVTAGGYALPGYRDNIETYKTSDSYDSELDAFKSAHTLDPEYGPEFMARVRMDGSGVDRLYKVDFDGTVAVWDGMGWDTLGHVDGDIWTYDNALDDPYDHCEKDHFVIDPESAVYISARMQQDPFGRVSIEEMDPDEANLFSEAAAGEDWDLVDYAVAASGALVAFIGAETGKGPKPAGATKAGDGKYTTAERSNIAKGAPRDATGQFAKTGGRAVVGNDTANGAGTIVGRSASTPGNILFKSDKTGETVDIPAKFTTPEDKVAPPAPAVDYGAPLDVSGILGEPRAPQGQTVQLPGTMEPITSQDLGQMLGDWDTYVQEARDSFTGKATDDEVRQYAKDTNQKIREVPTVVEGKATSIKDGKFVVESIPDPVITDDANPDNATAPGMIKAQALRKPILFEEPATPPTPNEQLRGVKNAERSADSAKAKAATAAQEKLRKAKNADRQAEKAPVGQSEKLRNVKNAERSADSAKAKEAAKAQERLRQAKNADRAAEKTPVGQSEKLRQVKNAERSADSKKIKAEADARERLRQAKNADRQAEKTPLGPNEKLRQVKNAERSADSKKIKAEADARERLRQAKNAERATPKPGLDRTERMKPKPDAQSGKYVVKKGDSLWSIAEKNKPKGSSTAEYWAKVMKANPKGNFKSGNPSLIYSGEKVNLPGYNAPSAPKMTPAQKRNADAKQYGQGILAGKAKAKAESDKRNADAKAYGEGKLAGIAKDKAQKSAKANADAKEYGEGKLAGIAKAKAESAKRNADAKEIGEAKKAGIAKGEAQKSAKANADAKEVGTAKLDAAAKVKADNAKRNADAKQVGQAKQAGVAKDKAQKSAKVNADAKEVGEAKKASQAKETPKPFFTPIKPATPKSLLKPLPAKQPQKDAVKDALDGLKDRTAYKQEIFKRGKAGARKRK